MFLEPNLSGSIPLFSFNYHPTTAAELLIDYTPAAQDSAQLDATLAVLAALASGSFSQIFVPAFLCPVAAAV